MAELIPFVVPAQSDKVLLVWELSAGPPAEALSRSLLTAFSRFGLVYSVRVFPNAAVAGPGFYAVLRFYSSRDARRAQKACDGEPLFQTSPVKVGADAGGLEWGPELRREPAGARKTTLSCDSQPAQLCQSEPQGASLPPPVLKESFSFRLAARRLLAAGCCPLSPPLNRRRIIREREPAATPSPLLPSERRSPWPTALPPLRTAGSPRHQAYGAATSDLCPEQLTVPGTGKLLLWLQWVVKEDHQAAGAARA